MIGRRWCAVIVFLATAIGVYGAYTFHSFSGSRLSLILALAGTTTVLPVLNAWNAELFPTELRADAVAWGNNILGRLGYVLSPIAIGAWAGAVGSYELPMRVTTVFPLIALVSGAHFAARNARQRTRRHVADHMMDSRKLLQKYNLQPKKSFGQNFPDRRGYR